MRSADRGRCLGGESGLRALLRDERGTVTAEFAIVLPAVLVVLGLVIGGVLIAAHRATLVSLAAEAARLEARGDAALAAARLTAVDGEVEVRRESRGRLSCVTLTSHPGGGLLAAIGVEAEGCAVGDGMETAP